MHYLIIIGALTVINNALMNVIVQLYTTFNDLQIAIVHFFSLNIALLTALLPTHRAGLYKKKLTPMATFRKCIQYCIN